VATDSTEIQAAAEAFGAKVIMTPSGCRNGTERCAAALAQLNGQPKLVINVQGDAPLTPPAVVSALIDHAGADKKSAVWTPALRCSLVHYERLQADAKRGMVGATTVVRTDAGQALYFSKQLIPHLPSSALAAMEVPVLLHMGIYAYSPASLGQYAAQPQTQLERLEGLEQLRFLDIGVPVHVLPVDPPTWDIWELNNESDVPIIEAGLGKMLPR
jgi:3-deoxy-manno-octulosonate cytidylyltransferase (CMP-KDO synthetase)